MSKKNIALDRLLTIQNHISNQPQQTGPIDLARERENASFNVKHMNWLFWGSKEFAEALQDAFLIIQRDPELHFSGGHPFDLTRPEEREATMKQIFRYIQLKKSLKDPLLFKALGVAMGMYSESFNMKVYVNDYLMAQSFKLFGTTEQYDAYINDIVNWKIIGCFAMTELGHSSFLRGLETTATYDRETDEFIIHSPTLTATKIWIGMAGQTATHTIAICQTIIDGKKCGTNWFIVQLRDQKTGKLMPGVTAGDVGAKYGRNGIDNGWIQFSHVRIPRTNMMMKWSKVDKGGEYIPSAFPAVSYSVLIGERLSVLSGAISTCGQVLTIACRYGCVRRQGANEEQIMDYQSHYVRLMPCVASTYVISVITRMIINKWEGIMKLAQTSQEEFISYLPDIHAISSGLKAAISWWGCEVLERVRRSMGGYAYSSYNGIGGAIGDWGVVTTGKLSGGDNFVLIQQSAKYLLGSFKQVSHGKKVTGSVEFLNDIQQIRSSTKSILSDERQLLNLDFTLDMYTWLCCKKVDVLAASLDSSTEGEETTWNENQVDLIKLGELYSYRFTLSEYIKGIKECSTNNEFKELIPILTKLGSLWAIHLINDSLYLFLEEEYFSKEQVKMIKKCYLKLCKEIRKECIPLVDSWGFSDFMLKAPLGKYDGDVYTAYLDTLKAAPNCMGIPDYWEKYVKNF
ncbi:acyl-CoA oxidase [Rhizophagus irregularis]|uniref:Acyl-coenzyme A oxidase n=1 Tax=Rhizophagus irregularis TaxID=588596 RepID=A0A2I1G4A1_9GLOM|nr:acyl-CoA oxidase [Rhizophagus irregularis]